MNREDIIKLAREAGLILLLDEDCFQRMGVKNFERTKRVIERFAALVAAAAKAEEREACAKLVEDTKEWKGAGWVSTLCQYTKRAIAAAIRARGQA